MATDDQPNTSPLDPLAPQPEAAPDPEPKPDAIPADTIAENDTAADINRGVSLEGEGPGINDDPMAAERDAWHPSLGVPYPTAGHPPSGIGEANGKSLADITTWADETFGTKPPEVQAASDERRKAQEERDAKAKAWADQLDESDRRAKEIAAAKQERQAIAEDDQGKGVDPRPEEDPDPGFAAAMAARARANAAIDAKAGEIATSQLTGGQDFATRMMEAVAPSSQVARIREEAKAEGRAEGAAQHRQAGYAEGFAAGQKDRADDDAKAATRRWAIELAMSDRSPSAANPLALAESIVDYVTNGPPKVTVSQTAGPTIAGSDPGQGPGRF